MRVTKNNKIFIVIIVFNKLYFPTASKPNSVPSPCIHMWRASHVKPIKPQWLVKKISYLQVSWIVTHQTHLKQKKTTNYFSTKQINQRENTKVKR